MLDVAAFRLKIDAFARRLPPSEKSGHELLNEMLTGIQEIEMLRVEAERAWADVDQLAHREFSGRALQAIVTMVGVKVDGANLIPAFESFHTYAEKLSMVRQLANDYATTMLEEDRKNRKERPL